MLRVNLPQQARIVDREGNMGLSPCVNHAAVVVMETGADGSLGAQEAATARVGEHQTGEWEARADWTLDAWTGPCPE